MIEEDDIDGLAAEYVLGSLDADERSHVAARRRTDAALDRAIKAWEKRLGPLSEDVPDLQPPPYVFQRVRERLSSERALSNRPTRVRQALVAGACALAACLALIMIWPRELPAVSPTLMAQLQRSGATTVLDEGPNIWTPFRFEVFFDLRASTMVISPVAAAASPSPHYQLWLLPRDSGPPISLGMLALPLTTTLPWQATYPPDNLPQATLVVSLEPEGGSPTGVPSGPLAFVGKLTRAAAP